MMHGARSAARGSATVAVVGVMASVALVASATIAVAAFADTAARAQGGADLAALAAARAARDRVAMGLPASDLACDSAREIADANHTNLLTCALDSRGRVTVVVSAAGPGLAGQALSSKASARAGPASGSS